ncbi:FtsX-like permease family protein [Pseudonocardia sp. TRM90224]|uniref:FtsX-like permease family protein n=1 Tax=Pseudonocardia sp. TRM90224 TaxID=2812678 RepID=UPI001E342C87|nr:ABC transporter permease [Pseudonocardia sp. TRM90224]
MIGPAAGALLAETRRKPGRLVLTGLAILIATVFAAGTLLFSETLRGYIAGRTQQTPSATAVAILPAKSAKPAEILDRLARVPGATGAVGVWSAVLPVSGAGATTSWEVTSDPMGGELSRITDPMVAGRIATSLDEVVIGASTAERTGLTPGAHLTLTGADGATREVTVTGVVPIPLDGVNALVAMPATVAALGGTLDQVDVPGAGGDSSALAAEIHDALGTSATVRTGADQRLYEVESASSSVTAVLLGVGVFAGVALVAAAVIVASTFRIVLTQRRTQLALLRCVGARKGQLIGAVLAEAVLTGLVAGLAGIALALLGGYTIIAVLRASGGDDVPSLGVPWAGLAGCLLVSVLVTVVAALAPALAAARIPPVAALGTAGSGEAGAPRTGRRLVLAGAFAVIATGSAALVLGAPDVDPAVGLFALAASGMVAFAAVVAIGPLLVRALGATVGRVIALVGRGPGRLATANAAQVPRRTAATISVLALGVGLTSALLVALASTQAAAELKVEKLFPADIAISTSDPQALRGRLAADPTLAVVGADESSVYVDPAAGVPEAQARAAVDTAVAGTPGVVVQYASDARAEVETITNNLRLIGLGLVGMTLLVAVVGVAVTLMLSVTERTRETGLLRAVGLTRGGVHAMVAWEAVLGGTGAALLGAVIGGVYGVLGAQVLQVGVGFVPAAVPTVAVLAAAVVLVAAVAAVVPAVRAGRVAPVTALQEA